MSQSTQPSQGQSGAEDLHQTEASTGPKKIRGTILLVDDDGAVTAILERVLQYAGYLPLSVPNGAEALKLLEHIRPDLIVLDLRMPVMSGAELISSLEARGSEVPIIILSAYLGDLKNLVTKHKAIQKPLDPSHFLGLVAEEVGQAQADEGDPAPEPTKLPRRYALKAEPAGVDAVIEKGGV